MRPDTRRFILGPVAHIHMKWDGRIDIDALCRVFAKAGCRPPKLDELRVRLQSCNSYECDIERRGEAAWWDWFRDRLAEIGATLTVVREP